MKTFLIFLISSSLSEPPTANIRPTPSTPSPSNKPSSSPGSKATPRASIRPMVTPTTVPIPTPTATVMPTTQTDNQEGESKRWEKTSNPVHYVKWLCVISPCSDDEFRSLCTLHQFCSAASYNSTSQQPGHRVCPANTAAGSESWYRPQYGDGVSLDFILFYRNRWTEPCDKSSSLPEIEEYFLLLSASGIF